MIAYHCFVGWMPIICLIGNIGSWIKVFNLGYDAAMKKVDDSSQKKETKSVDDHKEKPLEGAMENIYKLVHRIIILICYQIAQGLTTWILKANLTMLCTTINENYPEKYELDYLMKLAWYPEFGWKLFT